MANQIAKDANEVVEQQLHTYLKDLEEDFSSDVLSFYGALLLGVDNPLRNVIEKKKEGSSRDTLTVLLTTGGGYIEVVHRIVDTLRHHYGTVNFVVPDYAYSAGTVLVMSGDSIHMDYYSRLGPIDPQVETTKGQVVPGLGYLIQWERLIKKAKDGKLTLAEMQLMIEGEGFNQAELYKYEQERELSIALLEEWLVKYKFKNWKITETRKVPVTDRIRKRRASDIAKELNKTERWHIHGYGISMDVLRSDPIKLLVDDFGQKPGRRNIIRNYHRLLEDYMQKRSQTGIIHTTNVYLPFL